MNPVKKVSKSRAPHIIKSNLDMWQKVGLLQAGGSVPTEPQGMLVLFPIQLNRCPRYCIDSGIEWNYAVSSDIWLQSKQCSFENWISRPTCVDLEHQIRQSRPKSLGGILNGLMKDIREPHVVCIIMKKDWWIARCFHQDLAPAGCSGAAGGHNTLCHACTVKSKRRG